MKFIVVQWTIFMKSEPVEMVINSHKEHVQNFKVYVKELKIYMFC